MPRPRTLSSDGLTLQLQSRGLASAHELAKAAGVDRSTISRGLSGLGNAVLRIGAARSARYALRRSVRNLGQRWPLYRLDANGVAQAWGELHAVHGGFHWNAPEVAPTWLRHGYTNGWFPGLPFFLSDMRPQGFLGRALAREWGPRNGLPTDLSQWQDDDALAAMLLVGEDLVGDIVIGDPALTTILQTFVARHGEGIGQTERSNQYAQLATMWMQGGMPGSSAGGEQPKFTAVVRDKDGELRAVLVKFSPPMDTPSGCRWADLLAAEWHALTILGEHGHTAARAELIEGGGRRFLEVERFDRVGAMGRRGVLTLQAIEAGLLDVTSSDWPAVGRSMAESSLLMESDAQRLLERWCFGRLIGNTDMHLANASVWFGDSEPFSLAPAYDVLPMLFVPGPQGEIVPREFIVPPVLPAWREAHATVRPWAVELWQRVVADARISAGFRSIASDALHQIEKAP